MKASSQVLGATLLWAGKEVWVPCMELSSGNMLVAVYREEPASSLKD